MFLRRPSFNSKLEQYAGGDNNHKYVVHVHLFWLLKFSSCNVEISNLNHLFVKI